MKEGTEVVSVHHENKKGLHHSSLVLIFRYLVVFTIIHGSSDKRMGKARENPPCELY